MPIDRIGTDGIENGAVVPADLSTGAPNWDSSGNLSFNSGYGSTAVAYGCRAWVNFNGTGTVAIRASGNVSSITDSAVGVYTVNFTSAMPDANYSWSGLAGSPGTVNGYQILNTPTTSNVGIVTLSTAGATTDFNIVTVSVFR